MKLHQEPSTVQIATLLTVIGAEARNVFSTFTVGDDNRDRRQPVLESFSAYYQPLPNHFFMLPQIHSTFLPRLNHGH